MLRRRFNRSLLAAVAVLPLARVRLWAQAALFPGAHAETLRALAGATLPQSLGSATLDRIAADFVRWAHGYRPGAEMEHGYGFTRMSPKGASPVLGYERQLAALGSSGFAAMPLAQQREKISAELTAAKIATLPQTPDGRHIASDLMAYWFRSSEANDLCYNAAIRREDCRGFKSAGERPAPLAKGGGKAS